MEEVSVRTLVAGLAFLAGIVFGATAQKTHFCTMGAISDMVVMEDFRRFRSWLLAIAVAMVLSQAMWSAGLINLDASIYRTANLGWAGAILGGLMFGFGMTLAGGCGNKTLVRIGGGNLKSIVVFMIVGVTAYMTLRGLIALARIELESATNVDLGVPQGLDALLGGITGIPAGGLRPVLTAIVAGAILWWCFKDAAFRESRKDVAAGIIIGLMVPVGWYITGVAGNDDFEPTPLFSFTFIAPIGESLQYLMTFTGSSINFGIASVGGIITGAFLMALATGTFRVEAFTGTRDMLGNMAGAVLMGAGGVLALGCTIGQGLTGLSTLAVGSALAFLSILAGGFYGIKYQEEGTFGGALRASLSRG
ncbi:YeeE/YedE family protein [Azospirillum halopraeferens]|uniref:YeeE/YedE family protein n=1 Tax=Azospirillum halopraeferens TaxID=34010 RepID=UPI00042010DB|nr:YeeE/YedE family protein [Azospirillum halopraeferens]